MLPRASFLSHFGTQPSDDIQPPTSLTLVFPRTVEQLFEFVGSTDERYAPLHKPLTGYCDYFCFDTQPTLGTTDKYTISAEEILYSFDTAGLESLSKCTADYLFTVLKLEKTRIAMDIVTNQDETPVGDTLCISERQRRVDEATARTNPFTTHAIVEDGKYQQLIELYYETNDNKYLPIGVILEAQERSMIQGGAMLFLFSSTLVVTTQKAPSVFDCPLLRPIIDTLQLILPTALEPYSGRFSPTPESKPTTTDTKKPIDNALNGAIPQTDSSAESLSADPSSNAPTVQPPTSSASNYDPEPHSAAPTTDNTTTNSNPTPYTTPEYEQYRFTIDSSYRIVADHLRTLIIALARGILIEHVEYSDKIKDFIRRAARLAFRYLGSNATTLEPATTHLSPIAIPQVVGFLHPLIYPIAHSHPHPDSLALSAMPLSSISLDPIIHALARQESLFAERLVFECNLEGPLVRFPPPQPPRELSATEKRHQKLLRASLGAAAFNSTLLIDILGRGPYYYDSNTKTAQPLGNAWLFGSSAVPSELAVTAAAIAAAAAGPSASAGGIGPEPIPGGFARPTVPASSVPSATAPPALSSANVSTPTSMAAILGRKRKRGALRRPTCDVCGGRADATDESHAGEGLVGPCIECQNFFHPSCLEMPANAATRVRAVIAARTKAEADIAAAAEAAAEIGALMPLLPPLPPGWRCMSCKICEVCQSAGDERRLLCCDACDRGFHTYCMSPPLKKTPTGTWLCGECLAAVRCKSCGSATPGTNKNHRWKADYTLCEPCFVLRRDRKYCPLCERVYRANDKTPMVQCDLCEWWIHAGTGGCDSEVDDKTYEEFAADPTKRYTCPLCKKKLEKGEPIITVEQLRMQDEEERRKKSMEAEAADDTNAYAEADDGDDTEREGSPVKETRRPRKRRRTATAMTPPRSP